MRLGIRGKQIAGISILVGLAVVVLTALNVMRLAEVVLQESGARGELLANAISHRARELVITKEDPYRAFREDGGLQAILRAAFFGENVSGAAILDGNGVVVAHSDEANIGRTLPRRPDLRALISDSPLHQLAEIYSKDGQTLEYRQPLQIGDEPSATIVIGVSTVLMRQELFNSLTPAVYTGVIALGIGVLVAGLLSQLLLRPIHVLRGGLTRLGKGEFGVTLDLPQDDEFGELGSFFNTISQQLSADRSLLAGQKANLQSAVENLEDAVALFDPSGQLLFSNPAMQPTLPADATGRALQGLLPNGHPYRTLVEETLATRRSRGPVQPKDDELLMTHAVEGTDGQLMGVLLVARNLAYLSRMQSTLAYSRKLVALGRLTAGIAHEVKNPLNAMMIHLELLRTKIRSGALAARDAEPVGAAPGRALGLAAGPRMTLTAAAQGALEHVEVIESEIRRLDEVVQGFLKFTRPEDLRLQPVSIATIVDEILPVVAPEAQKNNVRVIVECPRNAPSVNGDAAMLRQVFLNLAINGCQAMPNGGTLRIACAAASRSRVEVRVEDTGVGIPPQNLERIFDLYFTTKDHGTGIGLSMVYRIVQMHDGEVEVQSTPGRGTTFKVVLPRANEV